MSPAAVLLAASAALFAAAATSGASADWRHMETGSVIPDEGYVDQHYVVKTADGAWLCALTTGPGREGARGQPRAFRLQALG